MGDNDINTGFSGFSVYGGDFRKEENGLLPRKNSVCFRVFREG